MAKRQRIWAARARLALIISLGGKCELCKSEYELEIDHPFGRDWKPSQVEYSARISRYRAEAKQGLVRVLCADCNCRIRPQMRQAVAA
jgi:hypothetical protein